jgi:3-oxoadipate enol-lactonase
MEGYLGCCEALRDADLDPFVADIPTRTLCLAGTVDPVVTTDAIRSLAQRLPRGEYDEIPASHLSNVEAPTTFTDRLARFLRTDAAR